MMKLSKYITFAWAALCCMAVSIMSCSTDDYADGGADGDADACRVGFNITVPVYPGTDSRATYEDGVGEFENAIDIRNKDFRVLLYTADEAATLLYAFDPAELVVTDETPDVSSPTYRTYHIWAEVGSTVTSHDAFRLVVIANWSNYPELKVPTSNISDLSTQTFEASRTFVAQGGRHIPMYGVKECHDVKWKGNSVTLLDNVWMLRAVAKIEVKPADDAKVGDDPLVLESMVLTKYNEQGTCAPKNVLKQSGYVTDADKYTDEISLNLPGGANKAGENEYVVKPDQNGVVSLYVPEYKNLKDADAPTAPADDYARMKLKFKGLTQSYYLDFKYYTEEAAGDNGAGVGDYFDIHRNYCYRYTVNMHNMEPEFKVDVLPYRAVTLKPFFGLAQKGISLSKNVVYLYTNSNENTAPSESSDTITAKDQDGKQIDASDLEWKFATTPNDVDDERDKEIKEKHPNAVKGTVCWLYEDEEGKCVVMSRAHKRGRDVITAYVTDKSTGITYEAELVVEVSGRHLGLDKTYLGLLPGEDTKSGSTGSFKATIIAETDAATKLRWKLLDETSESIDDTGHDVEEKFPYLNKNIVVLVNGKNVVNGATIGDVKDFEVEISGGLNDGTVRLWFEVDCPARNTTTAGGTVSTSRAEENRVQYSSYCEINVRKPSISCFPKEIYVTVGQTTSISSIIYPRLSDRFPEVKYEVLPFEDAEREKTDPASSYVSIDANGLITALKVVKDLKIRAYNDTDFPSVESPTTIEDFVTITINPDDLVLKRDYYGQSYVADHIELVAGESIKLKAISNGDDISSKVTWAEDTNKDSKLNLITIEKGGTIKAVENPNDEGKENFGTTTVTATYTKGDGTTLTQKCIVVVAKKRELKINQYPALVTVGASVPLSAYIFPDSRPLDKRNDVITWTSSTTTIMGFDTADKSLAVAKAKGTATLTASMKYGEQSYSTPFEIKVVDSYEESIKYGGSYAIDSSTSRNSDFEGENSEVHGKITNHELSYQVIPNGYTYLLKVDMENVKRVDCEVFVRYSYHETRVVVKRITDTTFAVTSNVPNENDVNISTRYNEVIVKITFKDGTNDTRRFAVFTTI